jgi:hypothetical protein
MSHLIARVPFVVHRARMTWEEELNVERLLRLLVRSRKTRSVYPASRDRAMRSFLRAWAIAHWPEWV